MAAKRENVVSERNSTLEREREEGGRAGGVGERHRHIQREREEEGEAGRGGSERNSARARVYLRGVVTRGHMNVKFPLATLVGDAQLGGLSGGRRRCSAAAQRGRRGDWARAREQPDGQSEGRAGCH